MRKRNHRPPLVFNGSRNTNDNRTYTRQDPVAAVLVDELGLEGELLGQAAAEIWRLMRYGVDVTPQIARNVVARYKQQQERLAEPRPVPIARREVQSRKGRFSDISVTGPVVYYMRIGNRIKIGMTIDLAGRLATINPEELMAVEEGDRTVEQKRHKQFRELRTHGEWFRYEGSLTAHVESLRVAAEGSAT